MDMTNIKDQIFAEMPGYVFYKNIEFCYVYGNKNFLKLAGLNHEDQLLGKTDYDMPWKQFSDKYRADDQHVIKGNIVEDIEFTQGTSKALTKVYTRKQPLIQDSKIIGVIGYARPIDMLTIEPNANLYKPIKINKESIKKYFSGLSLREAQCLFYLIRGHSMQSISEKLTLSYRTIETYISNIRNKMGLNNRMEIVTVALAQGFNEIIPPGILDF